MWRAVYGPTFLRDLRRLPRPTRRRIERLAFGNAILEDPYLGGRVQSMIGHPGFYKIRVGDYRIGLVLDSTRHVIEFRRVLHRRDIYRAFP